MAMTSGPELAAALMLLGGSETFSALPHPDYQNPWQGEVFSTILEQDTVESHYPGHFYQYREEARHGIQVYISEWYSCCAFIR